MILKSFGNCKLIIVKLIKLVSESDIYRAAMLSNLQSIFKTSNDGFTVILPNNLQQKIQGYVTNQNNYLLIHVKG